MLKKIVTLCSLVTITCNAMENGRDDNRFHVAHITIAYDQQQTSPETKQEKKEFTSTGGKSLDAIAMANQDKTPFRNYEKAVVLYSGGLDSSAVVGKLAAEGVRELHLLTFDNGAQDHLDYAKIKLDDFRQRFPQTTFHHIVMPARYLFKKLALRDIEQDIPKYKSNLVCVGCKMAMHATALVYALQNNISLVTDGFAKRQEDFPEQDPAFIEQMYAIYQAHGIQYRNPLYFLGKTKEDVKNLLFRYNLSTKSIEPGCLFGSTFSKASSETVKQYFSNKKHQLLEYVEEELTVTGKQVTKPKGL